MGLRLTVTSYQRSELGATASVVFGPQGGRIGRGRNNDWILPDPQRYLSAHHARVEFRDGQYYIEDISTNGTYVNESARALGRSGPHRLQDGDRLRFGDYRIVASLEADSTASHAEASLVRPIAPAVDFVATQGDIGAQLNIQELLSGGRSTDSRLRAVDAFGQPLRTDDTGLRAFDSGQKPQPKQTRTLLSMRRAADVGTVADLAKGADAFYRGAGLDPSALPPEAQARLLHVAGLLLREALVGLKDLTRTQREIREEGNLVAAATDTEHQALQQSGIEELLMRLLLGHDSRALDAVQWLRDSFADVRRHDAATAAALHGALMQFIPRLNSHTLAQWEKLPHLFLEDFGRAYAEAIKKSARPS
jgi:type VI secretion system protein